MKKSNLLKRFQNNSYTRGECVSFESFPKGPVRDKQIRAGWLVISSLDENPLRVVTGLDLEDHALDCSGNGVRLSLWYHVTTITFVVINGINDKAIILSSFSTNGDILEKIVVEDRMKEVVLQSTEPIASVTVSSESIEAAIPIVCLQRIDIGDVINQTEEEERRRSQIVDDIYRENPARTSELKDEATRLIRGLHEGMTSPNDFINDLNTALSRIGLPSISTPWQVFWPCVAINIVVMVSLVALLELTAEEHGVQTIADLAESDAVNVIMKFGYKETVALKLVKMLGPWVGGALIAAMAIYYCSGLKDSGSE